MPFGGETGIRTLGGSHLNGFQDRRIRPLCHLSAITRFIERCEYHRVNCAQEKLQACFLSS